MGYPVFFTHASMFFVGGNGDKSGRTALAGGCTRDWWEGQCPNGTDAEKAAAMAKLMVDGGPVVDETGCVYDAATRRITKAGCFGGAEAGMVAYVVETPVAGANLETMRYRITEADAAGDWIAIGDAAGGNATVSVKVGGAFDRLQSALDETDAGYRSVWIFTNLAEVLSWSIAVDTGGGSVMRNTFKRVAGYHDVPGDMDRGGARHESALDVLRNGAVDGARCVTLDADGGGFAVIALNGADNVVFENFALCGSSQSAISFLTACKNAAFINCRFAGVLNVIDTAAEHVRFEGCYSHDNIQSHHYILRGNNAMLTGCAGRMATGRNLCNAIGGAALVAGCITVGGQFGVRAVNAGGYATVLNNTFLGTEVDGVLLDAADGAAVFGNVFYLAPGAVGIYIRNGGSVAASDYNCFAASDGGVPAMTGSGYAGGEAPVEGRHSVQADPDFADVGSYDLRPRNPAVLRGGMPGPEGKRQVIGAFGQEYVFAGRGRTMNAGRIGIMR